MISIDLQREAIQKKLERADLTRIIPRILELLRPSIRLNICEASSAAVSRLGGEPNLPPNVSWPSRADGDLLSFICQIDLTELEPAEGLALPISGSLFFFCDTIYIPDGSDPGDIDGFTVIYSTLPLSKTPTRPTPRGLSGEQVFKGFALSPEFELMPPMWRANAIAKCSARRHRQICCDCLWGSR
jgi:hypothetical protein